MDEYESLGTGWRRGVVVINAAQPHSTKPEVRICASSNPARDVFEIRDGEDLWQWSRLEIRVNTFRRSYHKNNSIQKKMDCFVY